MSKIYLATQDWVNEKISESKASACIYGTLPTISTTSAGTAVQIPIPTGSTLFMITFSCDATVDSSKYSPYNVYDSIPRTFIVPISQMQPYNNYKNATGARPCWGTFVDSSGTLDFDKFFLMYRNNNSEYVDDLVFTKDNNKIGLYALYGSTCNPLCGPSASYPHPVRYCAQFS